jgi:hypothetical protein
VAIINGYITTAEFRGTYKGSTGSYDTGLIEDLIEAASRYIDNQTYRFFHTSTGSTGGNGATVYYTPELSDTLFINDIHVIYSLKTDEDGSGGFKTEWNTGVNTGDFWLMPFNASAFDNTGSFCYQWIDINPQGNYTFPKAPRSVQIVGSFGWSGVPADIKQACYEIVNSSYGRRSGQNMTAVAEVTAAGVVLTPEDIPQSSRKIINAYRRFV